MVKIKELNAQKFEKIENLIAQTKTEKQLEKISKKCDELRNSCKAKKKELRKRKHNRTAIKSSNRRKRKQFNQDAKLVTKLEHAKSGRSKCR